MAIRGTLFSATLLIVAQCTEKSRSGSKILAVEQFFVLTVNHDES